MTAINKFNKSMIYTIRSPHTDKYYIGSTTQILCKRFVDHKSQYKAYLKGGVFVTSFKIIELGDAYIELLEELTCENKPQLQRREGELIREHKTNCVNMVMPGRTKAEYNSDNSDRIKEHRKEYYNDNFDRISQHAKEYRTLNSDKLHEQYKEFYYKNIDKMKEKNIKYRRENYEKLKEQRRIKYEANSDKIKEERTQYRLENSDKINEQRRAKYAEKKLLKDLESITI